MLSLRSSRWLAVLLVCGLAAGARAQSQATTGVIEGTVFDESGAVVAGASVALKNTATNFERVVVTDVDGRFRGLLLPLGPYRVSASLTGFATLVREGTICPRARPNPRPPLLSTLRDGRSGRALLTTRKGHPIDQKSIKGPQQRPTSRLHSSRPASSYRSGRRRASSTARRGSTTTYRWTRTSQPVLRRAVGRQRRPSPLSGRGAGDRGRGRRGERRVGRSRSAHERRQVGTNDVMARPPPFQMDLSKARSRTGPGAEVARTEQFGAPGRRRQAVLLPGHGQRAPNRPGEPTSSGWWIRLRQPEQNGYRTHQ